MAEPGPEPGRAWRVLALCGAAVFLAAAAAGAALLAWNLAAAASRGSRCPELEPAVNATVPPRDPAPEVQELQRKLAEATQREKALARQLDQAKGVHRELEEALRACEGRQSHLQTQLMMLKIEMEEAKAQGTQMGAENGALTEALARWEAVAAESTLLLEEEQRRARAAEAESGACAAREAALRERVKALEAETDPQRRVPHPRVRSGSWPRPSARSRSRSRSRPSGGCRRTRGNWRIIMQQLGRATLC
ncbi:coiled-coil domain-containing protein 194 [Desmodus rotundus]|uniref:coiled-coil domain-containing protein 194 n=1 Tax=Desmodus rotundus TaxID=9430 RepID=UPI0023818F9F|nr:coiled-coil domain-containing protein 194 [Desmodus rotundus]